MTKRMLIDASHAEETRVVVLDGNRLDDFDVETSTKKQLKGNIYLAKVVRVEPSLQAAFVEYGGGRHGFLAFGEIHPDYYQIPVADRQRLLEMQAEEAREEDEAEEAAERAQARQQRHHPLSSSPRDSAPQDEAADPATDRFAIPEYDRSGPAYESVGGHEQASAEPYRAEWTEDSSEHLAESSDTFPETDGGGEPSGSDAGTPHDVAATAHDHEPGAATLQHDASTTPHDPDPAKATYDSEVAEPTHDSDVSAPEHESEVAPPPHSPGVTASLADTHDAVPARETDGDDAPRPAQAASIAQEVRFGDLDLVATGEAMHAPGAGSLEDTLAEADAAAPGPESAGEAGYDRDIASRDDIETPDPDAPPSDLPPPETIGGETDTYDGAAEARARRASRLLRNYRIQEVIRRRQIMLIQVVKEERGTKGAALTTYVSLAGRFCVLMPNSPRGGGISRKITSASDRRRLKEITTELEIPRGMGLIVRTAGAARPKPEIKRDCEYLMRLWDDIRDHTLKSVAPALIYEEASLIKRAIRDVYSRDVEEVLVDGEQGWRAAHDFMRMLMPSHAKKVQLWRPNGAGATQPLFSKHGVEAQLDGMLNPTVQLRSGGYLVFAQTEALVSIDVNSGRSTRERGIEETALKTNLEAAEEVARQLRLRDLAGLIVIDFIDMESRKNNAAVERRMKDALKDDRARIQVGHISHFGLLEMSRQRLRPSLTETAFVTCAHCGGAGHVRSVESAAIHVLRQIEEEGGKQKAAQVMVHCASAVTLYLLNHKRDRLGEIEARYAMAVHFTPDSSLVPPEIRIDRVLPQLPEAERRVFAPVIPAAPAFAAETDDEFEEQDDIVDEPDAASPPPATVAAAAPGPAVAETEEEAGRRRRRRRRRGGRREPGALASGEVGAGAEEGVPGDNEPDDAMGAEAADTQHVAAGVADLPVGDDSVPVITAADAAVTPDGQPAIDPTEFDENGLPQPRGPRRSRRGGRRRRGFEAGAADAGAEPAAPAYVAPVYTGPTPANPFGDQAFDIFDLMDQPLDIPPVPPNATAPGDVVPHVEPPIAPDAATEAAAMDSPPTGSGSEPVVASAQAVATALEPIAAPDAEPDSAPELGVIVVDVAGPQADAHDVIDAASVAALEPPPPSPEPPMQAMEEARHHLDDLGAEPHAATSAKPTEAGQSSAGQPSADASSADASSADASSADAAPARDASPDPSIVQPVLVGDKPAPGGAKRGWWRG